MSDGKRSLTDLCGGRFGIVPAAVSDSPEIANGAFRLYAVLCTRAKVDGTCEVCLKYIAKILGVSVRTVQTWKRELELLGWVEQLHHGDKAIGTFRVIRNPADRSAVRVRNAIQVGIRSAAKTPHAKKAAHPRCEADCAYNRSKDKTPLDPPTESAAEESSPDPGPDPEAGNSGQEDLAPDPPAEPVSRRGDLWLLGRHRLLCGDATERASLERVLDGALADMVFTDPPYNVDYRGGAREPRKSIINDNLKEDFGAFLKSACSNMLAVTKGGLYISMASAELHTLQRAFIESGGHWSTFIVWAKNHFTLGRADYQRQYEPILYGWREGTDHFWCGARNQGDVWFVDKPQVNDLHPTMKPVALVQKAIRNSSKSRDIVLDPFAGSGTTGIACEASDRMARMIEIDPAYCDVIVGRWGDYTGEQALLEPDGMSLEEAREARHGAGA